jgi:hypothetical protein
MVSMITPMDPVKVPGLARIWSPATAMYTPPEAATDPMETTTGFFSDRMDSTISWQGATDPPGVSKRMTMAKTFSSSWKRFKVWTTHMEETISPSKVKTPTLGLWDRAMALGTPSMDSAMFKALK